MTVALPLLLALLATGAWRCELVPTDWPILKFEEGVSIGLFAAAVLVGAAGVVAELVN